MTQKLRSSEFQHRSGNQDKNTADSQKQKKPSFRTHYLNTFVATNANDCPNILSHEATFRMGVLVPNYPEEKVVKLGDQEAGTSNVFQILQDLRIKQYQGKSESKAQ